ncbi:MAG: aspartate-semialdehyde dehydrogenase [Peptococcaceae bacterium]|nr:aspartate-semialdehyde dehydrogenase [Peptococcaceae bacterium]
MRVAIVGATGVVGQTLLGVLSERNFPLREVRLLASGRSIGKQYEYKGESLVVAEALPEAFRGVDIAFFCASGEVARTLAPSAVRAGAVVIDNSSAYRMDDNVPLIVPEVNAAEIGRHCGIIANPNCSTVIMAMALKPLYDAVGVKRVVVSTYQAVSGAGIEAVEELKEQVAAFNGGTLKAAKILPTTAAKRHYQIAFNVIPQVDLFAEHGYTKEEWKMVYETRKIFGDDTLQVSPTTVRVPVMWCHSLALNVETHRPLTVDRARELLALAPGVVLLDDTDNQIYPMPIDFPDRDEVFVGRLRQDFSLPNALNMWVVGNQLRKGAASNAVQIAEFLVKK